jgi:hypothetical protein
MAYTSTMSFHSLTRIRPLHGNGLLYEVDGLPRTPSQDYEAGDPDHLVALAASAQGGAYPQAFSAT